MRNIFTIIIFFTFILTISASDQLDPSGKPGTSQYNPTNQKIIHSPELLSQEKVNTHQSKLVNKYFNLAEEKSSTVKNNSIEAKPAYTIFENMINSDRENALIEIELNDDASQKLIGQIKDIENEWNSGNFDQAINQLKLIESQQNLNFAGIGISWKSPRIFSSTEGVDVQIGARSGISNMDLDVDVSNGHLFAALNFDDGVDRGWTVNISTDGGATWAETYWWNSGSFALNDVDAAVVAGYFWVGHIAATAQDVARMRRFNTTDGMVDNSYSFQTIFDFNVAIEDLSILSNADYLNNRIYYTALTADDSIRFYWANGDGMSWNNVPSGIGDADHGLAACWNTPSGNGAFLYFSYVNVNGQMYAAYHSFGAWTTVSLAPATTAANDVTSIAAYQDTVLIVYEDASDVLYRVSYDGGTSWAWAPIASGTSFYRPHVAGRLNGGFAVVYSEEAGAFDPVYYTRRNYSIANWSSPIVINEIDVGSAMPLNIEWIPPLSAPYAHGALFWSGGNVYFDRVEDIIVPDPENLLALDGYDNSIPLYWDPPTGYSPLKTGPGSGIAGAKQDINVQPNGLNTESVLLSYNVYRSTTNGGPYTMLDNVDRQYYRDLTANNGVTYYYVVEAVFDDAISGYSNEGSASAVSNGNVISAGWTGTTPNIDGVISAGEWVNATISDIRGMGITLPVTLFSMNDGNYLYFAVDDPNDTSATNSDQLGIYFDENHDYEWGQTSPADEGNYWIQYLTTPSVLSQFRGIYGWWPANLNFDIADSALAVVAGISYSNGHVQYEVQIDLTNSAFNASPGDDVGMYIWTYDPSVGVFGNWPENIELFGSTWSAPFMYGTLNLADDPLGIDDESPSIVTEYKLLQNYPNPFNPSTTIKYRIANQKPQATTLQIYNNLGQLVRTLVNAEQGNGEYTIVWNGLDNNNKEVASGLYFYKLQSGDFVNTQKLLKLK